MIWEKRLSPYNDVYREVQKSIPMPMQELDTWWSA